MMARLTRGLLVLAMAALLLAAPVLADGEVSKAPRPAILDAVSFEQRLGEQTPLGLVFRDEAGQTVRLGDLLAGKPAILTLNYYDCPNLCPLVLDGLVAGLANVPFTIGQEFNVVTVSIDPRETAELAAGAKRVQLRKYFRPGAADGWHFLTGHEASIKQLAAAVGVRYAYDGENDEYAHPSGVIVLTPEGRISRYLYGVSFQPRDLRLALVEAADSRIGNMVDQVLLFCYSYDPTTGKYSLIALNSIRLGGLVTMLALGGYLALMIRRDVKREAGTE